MSTRMGRVEWGAGKPRSRTSEAYWRQPVRWNAKPFWECSACGWRGESLDCVDCPSCRAPSGLSPARRRVFCASLADVFDNEVDSEWRADLLALIYKTPNLDWLLLTKRIGNAAEMLERAVADASGGAYGWARKVERGVFDHVWLGATICNQAEANRDIPKLLATPARVRFLSIEPMLGPITFRWAPWEPIKRFGPTSHLDGLRRLNWIICGGESGPAARPMHPDWVRSLRDQCAEAGTAFLFKQWGEWGNADCDDERTPIYGSAGLLPNGDTIFAYTPPFDDASALRARGGVRLDGRTQMLKVGKKRAGRLLDGVEHNGFPEVRHG